jgi:hypothetical protein
MSKYIKSATVSAHKINPEDFTEDELKLFDTVGMSQHVLTINFSNLSDPVYLFMRDVARMQCKLPIKFLKLVPGSYEYVSQKSQIFGKEQDIKNANVTIEPLNNDYANIITYTPINQSLPIDTIVTLNISTPYNDTVSESAQQKFFWSNNLKTNPDIAKIIMSENPDSITTNPWMRCVHYGSIDIGSIINAKFTVDWADTELFSSYSLFNFRRDDNNSCLHIWMYDAFNLSFTALLEMISEHDLATPTTKTICAEIIKCMK